MDTPPTTLEGWYAKAAHFANVFNRLNSGMWVTRDNKKKFKLTQQYYQGGSSHRDPNAMDVDAMSRSVISKMVHASDVEKRAIFRINALPDSKPGNNKNSNKTEDPQGKFCKGLSSNRKSVCQRL